MTASAQVAGRTVLVAGLGFSADPAGELLLDLADPRVPGPHDRVNALPAAALARAIGVDHVDDSQATNPHAAGASLAACPRVDWIAGGLLEGADVGPLAAAVAGRPGGVARRGRDRDRIATSLARHAPMVPVVTVASGDDDGMGGAGVTGEATMTRVVAAAVSALGDR